MDPLSIAASLAGLITIPTQIVGIIHAINSKNNKERERERERENPASKLNLQFPISCITQQPLYTEIPIIKENKLGRSQSGKAQVRVACNKLFHLEYPNFVMDSSPSIPVRSRKNVRCLEISG